MMSDCGNAMLAIHYDEHFQDKLNYGTKRLTVATQQSIFTNYPPIRV